MKRHRIGYLTLGVALACCVWLTSGLGSDSERGAVWILFLNADKTVKTHQKISSTHGGFTGVDAVSQLDDEDLGGRLRGLE